MSEAKFTKGPWISETNSESRGNKAIVYFSDDWAFNISNADDCIANAHLIAAAPEMYRMLEMAANILSGDDAVNELGFRDIRALLAKARGEGL